MRLTYSVGTSRLLVVDNVKQFHVDAHDWP